MVYYEDEMNNIAEDVPCMVIMRLFGGLGNQLFQYAYGRQLALNKNVMLKLDITSGFRGDYYERKYSLDYFNIVENIADKKDLPHLLFAHTESPTIMGKLSRMINSFVLKSNPVIILEANTSKDKIIDSQYDDLYLVGYWQDEKYFHSIRKILMNEMSLKVKLNNTSEIIAENIKRSNSVAIHYRNYTKKNRHYIFQRPDRHGILEEAYYTRAVNYICSHIENPYFYVFSDDEEMALEKFNYEVPHTVVTHNKNSFYEDLILMSMCRHQIIANSSFSWWSAWLNKNENKIVIAPLQWFSNSRYSSKDIILPSWIKL